MKQVPTKTTANTRERSERTCTQTKRIAGPAASFFFHPVAQIYGFTHLLSSFTHPHVYASACAYRRTRMRGVGKKKELKRTAFSECRLHRPTCSMPGKSFSSPRWSSANHWAYRRRLDSYCILTIQFFDRHIQSLMTNSCHQPSPWELYIAPSSSKHRLRQLLIEIHSTVLQWVRRIVGIPWVRSLGQTFRTEA